MHAAVQPAANPPGDHYEDLCLYATERLRQMDGAVVQGAPTLLS